MSSAALHDGPANDIMDDSETVEFIPAAAQTEIPDEAIGWLDSEALGQYVLWAMCFLVFRITLTLMRINNKKYKRSIKKPCTAMFVLGSGGHTTEMLRLIGDLNERLYSPRIYVYSDTDKLSQVKATQAEGRRKDFHTRSISRIREVHQSLASVPLTAIKPFLQAPLILLRDQPDVLVVNGPGTCIPLVIWSFILGVLCFKRPVVVFVESFCRVENLSLTAKILRPFVDRLIVQWRPLYEKYRKSTRFFGLLV